MFDDPKQLAKSEQEAIEKLAAEIVEEEKAPVSKLDPRRQFQCRHDGCDSPAVWEVHMHLRYGVRHKAIESLKSSLKVCDAHRKDAAAFMTNQHNKKTVSLELAKIGRLSLDWTNAMVEFVPLGEKPWGPQNMTAGIKRQ